MLISTLAAFTLTLGLMPAQAESLPCVGSSIRVQVALNTALPDENKTLIREACGRLSRFVKQHQLEVAPGEFSLEFTQTVQLVLKDHAGADQAHARIFALYDGEQAKIQIHQYSIEYVQTRNVMADIPMNRSYYISILTHEMAHALLDFRLAALGAHREHATHEFFAYTVQIATLPNREFVPVIQLFPKSEFGGPLQINSFLHFSAAHLFGVMSYRYGAKHPQIIQQIWNGEFKSGDSLIEGF